MTLPARGDVWWVEEPTLGRRPVVVLTRDAAIPVLTTILVAPITRTVRRIPTEVSLEADDGMPQPCAITLDNLRTVPRALLTEHLTSLSAARMHQVCRALQVAVAC